MLKKLLSFRSFIVLSTILLVFEGITASCINAATHSKAFLWEIRSPTATVYLLGSMHFANQELYPLNPVIEEAYAKSDTLVLEVNPLTVDPNQVQSLVQRKGYYGATESIADHVTPEVFDLLQQFIQKHNLPASALYRMKPGMLSLNLATMQLMNLGYSPDLGIDLHFAKQAENNKDILELETIQQQLSMFFSMPNGDKFLQYTLMDLENMENFMNQTIQAWQIGDATSMYNYLLAPYINIDQFQPFLRKIFFNRNIRMAAQIRKFLKTDNTYFVVVGAGHLVSDQGIIALLQKQKYTIKQLENEKTQ